MNICFIIPPSIEREKIPERIYGCTFSYYRQPELPMLYIAALLLWEGHEVLFRDFTVTNSWEDFYVFVKNSDCDAYIFHTVLLAESTDKKAGDFIIKNTRSKVIYFGPHPTLEPGSFLWDERCCVARGEAEFVIRDLLRGFETGNFENVKGISYLKDGQIVENQSYGIITVLDALPFPARHLLPRGCDYFNPKLEERPVTLMLTSRGCSFRCYYCVPNSISWARELEWKRFNKGQKPPVSLRSPVAIADEFTTLKAAGYKAVSVVDDMFLFGGKQRILEICTRLESVGLPFGALSRCEFVIDEEIVSALARAGCRYIDIGIESLDKNVLDDIKKDLDVRKVRSAIEMLNKYGIEPKANIMFGSSPMETKKSIEHTVKEISRSPIKYCMFLIATPFPGTEFEKRARQEGWVLEPDIDDLEHNLSPTDKSLISYPHLSNKDLEEAVKRANRIFYLKIGRIWFQLKKIKSLKMMKDLFSTGLKVIK